MEMAAAALAKLRMDGLATEVLPCPKTLVLQDSPLP